MAELILIISVLCKTNITNVTMPKEEKIACIEMMTNCLVGPNGSYLKSERKNCENKYETFKKNNERNND